MKRISSFDKDSIAAVPALPLNSEVVANGADSDACGALSFYGFDDIGASAGQDRIFVRRRNI
jgi:hypothetical protein